MSKLCPFYNVGGSTIKTVHEYSFGVVEFSLDLDCLQLGALYFPEIGNFTFNFLQRTGEISKMFEVWKSRSNEIITCSVAQLSCHLGGCF